MIEGPGPFENDCAFTEYGAVIYLLAERVDAEVKQLRKKPLHTEQALVGLICCLRTLAKACPLGMNASLEPWRVTEWKEAFDVWYEAVKEKLPAKHRAAIRTVAHKEFAQLLKSW